MSEWLLYGGIAVIVIIIVIVIVTIFISKAKSKEIYYHYTTPDAAENIIRNGLLIRSEQGTGDAYYGTGVYLTQLPPSAGRQEIAMNNWDGGKSQIDMLIRRGISRALIISIKFYKYVVTV